MCSASCASCTSWSNCGAPSARNPGICAQRVEISCDGAGKRGMSMRGFWWLALCPLAAVAADGFKLNSQEYFERPGINVMYGQDYYPEGHQGGLSILMHDERIASNGDVRLEDSPGQWSPIPKPGKREVNAATQEIRVGLSFPDVKLAYTVRVRPEGESIRVSVDFPAPLPKAWVGKVGFNLELFPG